ncbi:type 4a pilus biogenesis protein PilO [Candidatus Acidulodesulfobacterium sp. H_13]|uniref:type 4a pilus biogenesis protein PilO n=1 Tax=Candidatus Acidulodesulfobacterium sp. H_13 TaxID=3395470 RepID=UPI003AF800FB
MKIIEYLKKMYSYLKTNKTVAVILMMFVFLYLINQDIFFNKIDKNLKFNNAAILKLRGEMNRLKNTTGSLSNEKNTLLNLENQISDLKSRLKNEEAMLPETFEIADFIKNISASRPADNFIIEKIIFGKPTKYKKNITALPVNISIVGGFNKSITFIKNIDIMKRIFVIDYVSVKASKKLFPDIKSNIKGFVFSMNR